MASLGEGEILYQTLQGIRFGAASKSQSRANAECICQQLVNHLQTALTVASAYSPFHPCCCLPGAGPMVRRLAQDVGEGASDRKSVV